MISPEIFEDSSSLHIAAANYFMNTYLSATANDGSFHVALSGGSTPKYLYQLLAKTPYAENISWEKVHIYFGDERFVLSTHKDSNFNMAKKALLQHIAIPQENIHTVQTDLATAQLAAKNYQQVLIQNLPQNIDGHFQFDLVLLGLGADGHTASLFPGTPILQEQKKLYDAVYVEKLDSWRTSLTYPAINHAKHILLLSEGKGKTDIIHTLVKTKQATPQYPVAAIQPSNVMHWYIDKAAAAQL